jgi:hypothetical protein
MSFRVAIRHRYLRAANCRGHVDIYTATTAAWKAPRGSPRLHKLRLLQHWFRFHRVFSRPIAK